MLIAAQLKTNNSFLMMVSKFVREIFSSAVQIKFPSIAENEKTFRQSIRRIDTIRPFRTECVTWCEVKQLEDGYFTSSPSNTVLLLALSVSPNEFIFLSNFIWNPHLDFQSIYKKNQGRPIGPLPIRIYSVKDNAITYLPYDFTFPHKSNQVWHLFQLMFNPIHGAA
jgi:hypothetical protein